MSKTTKLQNVTIAVIILMVISIKLSLPVWANDRSLKANGSIMSFDFSKDLETAIDHVEKYTPDFFIIHDIKDPSLELSENLKTKYSSITYHDDESCSIKSAIFYKNEFDVLKSKTIWLSGTPDKASKVKGSKNCKTCTYALFSRGDTDEKIAVFAASIDGSDTVAKKEAMYLFSRFQCYRDYYPTLLCVKCSNAQNVNMFEDEGLSHKLYSQSGMQIFASSSVQKISDTDGNVKFCASKSPKKLDQSGKYIALTFDDGPTRLKGRTDKILQSIEKYNVKATFFVLGSRISDDNPIEQELLKKERSLGCEIGNHTYNHDSYAKLKDNKSIEGQINETDLLIEKICKGSYATLLRPPGGIVNNKPDLDRPIINWSVDTLDWSSKQTVKDIIDTVKRDSANGKIVLMHDINTKSASVIDDVIKYLLDNDYNVVTVSELMEFCDVDMWAGYIYTDANHEKRTTFCN